MKLNLTAVDSLQERILAYLLENASENLANKINSGTPFTKDNVQLINKKDLTSFMHYATEEARKLAKNGATYACIDDATVFGWAMHYFEEESIEGKLFNLDGTEYKPVRKSISKSASKQKNFVAPTTKVDPPKPQQEQRSLFDMLEPTTQQDCEIIQAEIKSTITAEPVENQIVDTAPTVKLVAPPVHETPQIESEPITTVEALETKTDTAPILEPSIEPILVTTNIDADTGEVLETIPVTEPVEETKTTQPVKQEQQTEPQTPTFDRETMIYLATLLDNKIEIA